MVEFGTDVSYRSFKLCEAGIRGLYKATDYSIQEEFKKYIDQVNTFVFLV